MFNMQRVAKSVAHRRQLEQLVTAINQNSYQLEKLVEELAEENARLRVALMRAERYNEASPGATERGHTCVQLPPD